jgi:peptidoglycan hydrolase CwlO-like protein
MNKIKYLQFFITLLACLSILIYYMNKNSNKLLSYIISYSNHTNEKQTKINNKLDSTNIKIDSLHIKIDYLVDKIYDMQDNLDTLKKETRKLNRYQKKTIEQINKNYLPCPR